MHAECNCVLRSVQSRVLHSAGGSCITLIAKQMDEGFAGTKLYSQRVFFTPPAVCFVPAHPL